MYSMYRQLLDYTGFYHYKQSLFYFLWKRDPDPHEDDPDPHEDDPDPHEDDPDPRPWWLKTEKRKFLFPLNSGTGIYIFKDFFYI